MEKNTELVGVLSAIILLVVCIVLIMKRPKVWQGSTPPRRFDAIVAGLMAWAYYVLAALLAGAEFPGFLREHPFDGLAPAFLVGLLIDRLPRHNPTESFRIFWPVVIPIMFFLGGALVFTFIAAAAVFSSGANNFALPLIICGLLGGLIFPVGYRHAVTKDPNYAGMGFWHKAKWWFKTRQPAPEDADVVPPGNPTAHL